MTIVKPHEYADTPIFREMLYERAGRYPGTPEGEEPIDIVLGPQEPAEDLPVHTPEPTAPDVSQSLMARLIRIQPLTKAVMAVPAPPEISTFKDPQETQPMPIPLLVEPDEE